MLEKFEPQVASAKVSSYDETFSDGAEVAVQPSEKLRIESTRKTSTNTNTNLKNRRNEYEYEFLNKVFSFFRYRAFSLEGMAVTARNAKCSN